MRTIGHLDSEQSASRLSDLLYVENIDNQVESEDDGSFSVWVLDDDKLGPATEILKTFRADPNAAQFAKAETLASERRREEEQSDRSRRSTVADTARVGYERNFQGTAWVTMSLIALSIMVAFITRGGDEMGGLRALFISDYFYDYETELAYNLPAIRAGNPEMAAASHRGIFPEVRAGQVWRLVTPIFLHFGLFHLIFNCLLLKDLGTFIETRFGGRYLLFLVLATAILSNLGQGLWGSPMFGGMSGVDYGLFGFLWIRGKFDPAAGWQLNKNTVVMLMGWFVICVLGSFVDVPNIPKIANTAHSVGLAVGMAWGYFSSRR